jgi:hypothetical protein
VTEPWFEAINESRLVRDLRESFTHDAKKKRTKVAVIDTGYDPRNPFFDDHRPRQKRIKDFQDWTSPTPDNVAPDLHGHGTFVLSLLMRVAPCADIYVARVARTENDLSHAGSNISQVSVLCSMSCRHRLGRGQTDVVHRQFAGLLLIAKSTLYPCPLDFTTKCPL